MLRLLIAWVLVLASLASSAEEGGGNGGQAGGAQYLALESVLVNLEGRRHYLRADIQLLVADSATLDKIRAHMPAIRHALIMLYSGRNPDQLSMVEEREKLRQATKEEISRVLQKHSIDKGLQDVFFTDFLVQ